METAVSIGSLHQVVVVTPLTVIAVIGFAVVSVAVVALAAVVVVTVLVSVA